MHVHTFKRSGRRIIQIKPNEFRVPDDPETIVGEMLRDLKRIGLSPKAVGDAIGVHPDTVRFWTQKTQNPRWHYFMALKQLYAAAMDLAKKEGIA